MTFPDCSGVDVMGFGVLEELSSAGSRFDVELPTAGSSTLGAFVLARLDFRDGPIK